jgi:DNA-binding IclR family transcriptional regulator
MSWATLNRVLTQLEEDEFLERDKAGVYRIGRRTWLLGSTYLVGHRLLELAVPFVKQVAAEVPNAVFQVVERSESTAVVLYSQEAASGEMITRTTYGHHFPLHTGSKGLVLLAYASEEFIKAYLGTDLVAMTPQSVVDPDEIRAKLEEIRRVGNAVTVGDVQSFTGSVAAPVYDETGGVVAAICAVAPRARLDGGERQAELVDAVMRVAQAVSLGMGWQPMRSRS